MNKDAVAEISQQYQVEAVEKVVPEGYKQTEVGVIPEDWEVLAVGDAFEVCNNLRLPISAKVREGMVGVYPYYGPTKVQGSINEYRVEGEFALIGEDGDHFLKFDSVPQTQYVTGKFNVNNHAHLIRSKIGSAKWFYFFFRNRDISTHLTRQGAGRFKLNKASLEHMLCAVPTAKEQEIIASTLFDTDALLSELEKLIAKKQAIKTATMQQLLTGRTRLPEFSHHPDGSKKGYKQSELGEIPEDWEAIQLGEIATFLKGAGLPKSDLIDSGKNRCIHYGQLFTVYGPKIEKILSSTDIDGSIKSETNDVLMPTSDVTPNGLATASCILESGIVLGGDILVLRSKKELLNGVFFAYLITVMRDQIMQLVTGSTVYHLYGSDMAKFFFARPPIEEQTTIATILSDMDEEIQALEHRLTKTRQIKQGMMQELLTGKTRLVNGGVND